MIIGDNHSLSIFSTYTLDIVTDKIRATVREQPGGPLLFLEKALRESNIDFVSFHNDTINIEIQLNDHGETGRILNHPRPSPLPKDISGWTVISTVFNEWELSGINRIHNKIFLDVQGYLRNTSETEKERFLGELEKNTDKIVCLKGTSKEIGSLPNRVLKPYKERILIITKGVQGVECHYEGKRYVFRPKKIVKSIDTIGAGDTFFGYFVSNVYNGSSVNVAVEQAMRSTEIFLETKCLNHQN